MIGLKLRIAAENANLIESQTALGLQQNGAAAVFARPAVSVGLPPWPDALIHELPARPTTFHYYYVLK
jgi:hypothetical protein